MKIHYFQRYHDKENVATANTMLLLSRLYQYSTGKFFKFLKSEFFPDSFEPELTLQDKSIDSVPDATITQESFKIVVETEIRDKLIPISDSWKFMRMQLANQTLNFNVSNNIYYEDATRNFRAHDYLGLYSNKSVRAIGKINARILAIEINGELNFETEYGTLTLEHKDKIKMALEDGISHGYDLKNRKHRYFFVEKFYDTDFKKTTPRAPMGTRIFDLSQILETDTLPETDEIAKKLREKGWG